MKNKFSRKCNISNYCNLKYVNTLKNKLIKKKYEKKNFNDLKTSENKYNFDLMK